MAYSRGLDLSHYQDDPLSFHAMRASGLEFVGLKATEGAGYTDPHFQERRARAHAVGFLKVLPYHFLKANVPAKDQALHFASKLVALAKNEIPVIDVEGEEWAARTDTVDFILEFVFHAKSALSLRAAEFMLYTPLAQMREHYGDDIGKLAFMPLWIARYRRGVDLAHPDPGDVSPWPKWTAWQYTQDGSAAGVRGDVDLNVWNSPLSK